MGFWGDLFGFGTESKQKKAKIITKLSDFDQDNIYPYLVSKKTKKLNLYNEYFFDYHTREDIYSDIVVIYIAVVLEGEEDDERGDANMYLLRTADNYNDESIKELVKKAVANFEKYPEPLEVSDFLKERPNLKILTCAPGLLSSEKLLSKKHMLEAHEMLGSDELLVSIPRKGLIFICSKNIDDEDYNAFLNLHAGMVLTDIEGLELLCEDIFVVINGEVDGVFVLSELTKELNSK